MVRTTLTPLVGIVALAACETPGVRVLRPDPDSSPPTAHAMHVALEDTALAQALGWEAGVPEATVVLHRLIDPFQPETLYTDTAGRVAVGGLLPGWYLVAGYRILTADEAALTGGVVRAFGDGRKTEQPQQVELRLRGEVPGSIVFSEHFGGGGTLELLGYRWAQFYELYNNTDSTVHLDGMLLGTARGRWGIGQDTGCEQRRRFRDDPVGLWSLIFHQFPGSGSDYPVPPGGIVVIALDAVDHSQAHSSLPDLSGADFEFEGSADTDNPDVPNLPSVGQLEAPLGHGMIASPHSVHFLARPADVATLTTTVIGDYTWTRIPIELVLDVFHSEWVDPSGEPPFIRDEYCTWVNRSLDRVETPYYRPGGDNRISQHRRILRQSGAGRLVLHDVNASFVDWLLALYTPGQIEY